ncbi:hypothetical protein G6F65_021461 [Rhizopus arrhizus]|nr:hypothetical protein G6F65_021461 [Rhizopus arrhizus]
MTRSASIGCSCSTVRISSLTIRPSGMPVHADTISATIWASTQAGTSGCSPCNARSSSINPANRCCSGVSAGATALRRDEDGAAASATGASCP